MHTDSAMLDDTPGQATVRAARDEVEAVPVAGRRRLGSRGEGDGLGWQAKGAQRPRYGKADAGGEPDLDTRLDPQGDPGEH